MLGPRVQPPELRPATASQPAMQGPVPDATRCISAEVFRDLGSRHGLPSFPCSWAAPPLAPSGAGPGFPPEPGSQREGNLREVEVLFGLWQRLTVNQLRHLPVTRGSARPRQKGRGTKTATRNPQHAENRRAGEVVFSSTRRGPAHPGHPYRLVAGGGGEAPESCYAPRLLDYTKRGRKAFQGETPKSTSQGFPE